MIGAIVKNDIVQNVIVLDDGQKDELEKATGGEIVDARPYGLAIGDLRTARGWTRNAGGEQMLLPALEPEQYDSYTVAVNRAAAAEEQAGRAGEEASAQAVAIVSGRVADESKPELMAVRGALDRFVARIADEPEEIYANLAAVRAWTPGAYAKDDVRLYGGAPYKCLQAHDSTGNAGWTPADTPSLWTRIDQTHAGTQDDPIPYSGNMELFADQYYTQDGVLYRCTRSTGQPVYHPLSALVGLYVETVEG